MSYTVDIQTTGGDYPPDFPDDIPVPLGMGCASSTQWCRVTRGELTTGWHKCRGVPSIIKANALFNTALETYDDVDGMVAVAYQLVTGDPWPDHMPGDPDL